MLWRGIWTAEGNLEALYLRRSAGFWGTRGHQVLLILRHNEPSTVQIYVRNA
jgi:hypothetical protein